MAKVHGIYGNYGYIVIAWSGINCLQNKAGHWKA